MRACPVCSHPNVNEANRRLIVGEEATAVAGWLGLKPGAVMRHKRYHVPRLLQKVHEGEQLLSARSLVDIFNALFERLEKVIQRCEAAGDWRAVIVALREQREWVQDAVKMQIGGSDREVTFHVVYDDPLPGDPPEGNARPRLPPRTEPVQEVESPLMPVTAECPEPACGWAGDERDFYAHFKEKHLAEEEAKDGSR
jgi:hypothetical protein